MISRLRCVDLTGLLAALQDSDSTQSTASAAAHSAVPAAKQTALPAHEQSSAVKQEEVRRRQDALIGSLIAEAEEAECRAADLHEQLQQLEEANRLVLLTSLLSIGPP